jgi:hypothetical protein
MAVHRSIAPVCMKLLVAWAALFFLPVSRGQIVGPSRVDRPPPARQPTARPVAPPPAPVTQPVFDRPGMVLLLSRPAKFTDERIGLALNRATGEKFAYTARGANHFVASRFVNTWNVVFGDLLFELFVGEMLPVPERRWPGPGAESPEQQWAYEQATGEVRVVWTNPGGDEDRRRRAERFIGSLLSELINADCLAVMKLDGATLLVQPRTSVTARELRSSNPSLATSEVSLPAPADRDASRVAEAQAQAQATWPVFVEAVQSRQPGDLCVVLVRTGRAGGGNVQSLVAETAAADGTVRAAAPGGGARVAVGAGDAIDWVLYRGGRIEGRFLGTVARELRVEQQERGGQN